jgi:hypothetical protein
LAFFAVATQHFPSSGATVNQTFAYSVLEASQTSGSSVIATSQPTSVSQPFESAATVASQRFPCSFIAMRHFASSPLDESQIFVPISAAVSRPFAPSLVAVVDRVA